MINYDSIISAYNDKPTLMEWLKKVEEALKGASATSFSVNKKGNATISFQINFDDGTSLESGDIILQQGESVTGASIVNGHLILTLSNGDNIDAGNLGAVSSFSIDGSQHLIVNYQDGTTNDLGAIFNGNVNISGILNVTGKISGGEIVETMAGYSAAMQSPSGYTLSPVYIGAVKNGNKLTLCVAVDITKHTGASSQIHVCDFTIPHDVWNKLNVSSTTGDLFDTDLYAYASATNNSLTFGYGGKLGSDRVRFSGYFPSLTPETTYYWRLEVTFLLNESLI